MGARDVYGSKGLIYPLYLIPANNSPVFMIDMALVFRVLCLSHWSSLLNISQEFS